MLGTVFISALVVGSGWYLKKYFEEKARNLAQKQDLPDITQVVEQIRAEYEQQLEALRHQNQLLIEQQRGQFQLRLAAVDKRLQAHQEAYALWRALLAYKDDEEIREAAFKCEAWWAENCLYLTETARRSFRVAYNSAYQFPDLSEEKKEKQIGTIVAAGTAIVEGVELPSLGEQETIVFASPQSLAQLPDERSD